MIAHEHGRACSVLNIQGHSGMFTNALIRSTQKDYITSIVFSILEVSLNSQFNSYRQLDLTKHRTAARIPL